MQKALNAFRGEIQADAAPCLQSLPSISCLYHIRADDDVLTLMHAAPAVP